MPAQTTDRSATLFDRAKQSIAGGVSSDARRGPGVPLYVDRARGSRIWDVDGTEYVDFVLGQGPSVLGHCPPAVTEAVARQAARGIAYSAQHEAEIEVAELLTELVPSAELVRFNSVGSEAAHAALRLARGHTGRTLVVKFEGHYHGWLDPVLYSVHPPIDRAGAAAHPELVPGTAGMTPGSSEGLLLAPWNDLEALQRIVEPHAGDIAAIIMEPVMCNSGCIEPLPGYLAAVRELCDRIGALLVFDEVITGFRVAAGGAQEWYGVTPDLTVLGKALASGMQVSALAGRAEVMGSISDGRVAHAGTFNSQPVSMAGALATLRLIADGRERIYPGMRARGRELMAALRAEADAAGVPALVTGPGPVFQVAFTDAAEITGYRGFAAADHERAGRLHRAMLRRGVSIVPRGLWFLSDAHGDDDLERAVTAFRGALRDQGE